MRVVKLDSTSGLSRYQVIFRKPSASHCVQNLLLDLYNPSRLVFSCGLILTLLCNSNASGTLSMQRVSSSCLNSDLSNILPFSLNSSNSNSFPLSCRAALGLLEDGLRFIFKRASTKLSSSNKQTFRSVSSI